MFLKKTVGKFLAQIGLKDSLNEIRFSITRPDWWLDRKAKYRFYSQFFSANELCFDVGANYGRFSKMLWELGARVVTIEPQPYCISRIKETLASFDDAVIVNMAVGSQEGMLDMMLAGEGMQISSMSQEWIEQVKKSNRFPGYNWDKKISVPVTTLDNLIDKYGLPAFCKIDVEGYEIEVLKGLSHAPRFISFEYTPENQGALSACINQIIKLGEYEFNLALHQNWQFYWDKWLKSDEIINKMENSPKSVFLGGGDVYALRKSTVVHS